MRGASKCLTTRSTLLGAIPGQLNNAGSKRRKYGRIEWVEPDDGGDTVSRMDGLSPSALRREVRDRELILNELPAAGDKAAEKRWGEAMIDLCVAMPKLARFEELLQRIEAAEPTLKSIDRLGTVWIYTRVTRAAALTALTRYDEALATVDAVLDPSTDAQVKRQIDGQSDAELGRTKLGFIATARRGQTRTEASSIRALSRVAVLALETRVVVLMELGRLDEAYQDACRLADAPDATPAERSRIERALVSRMRIARRQHRYDRVLGAGLRVARLKARGAIDPRCRLDRRRADVTRV
jgi:hypothetical protein